jgi:putative Holliday junction resolvase
MGRVLAVDWGTKRLGVAVSDETRFLARPLPTLNVTSWRDAAEAVERIAGETCAEVIVLGHPVHMDGREGESARRVRRLAARLEARLPGVRLVLWDERLSSREAQGILHEKGERLRGNKGRVDQVAAAVLLQSYLDSERP